MQKLPSLSRGTTDKLEIADPTTKLPFDLVCGPACNTEHLSAVMYPAVVASVIATLTNAALEPAGAASLIRVMLPAATGAPPPSRVSSLRVGCVGVNSSPPTPGGAK